MGHFGEIGFPVVLVLDGDVAREAVFADFIKDGDIIDDAGAEGAIM